MQTQHGRQFSRRSFLGGLTLAGTAGLLTLGSRPVAAEPPPETTRIRLHKTAGVCYAPQYVAEELLYGEGFTDVHYVEIALAEISQGIFRLLSSGEVDITTTFAPTSIIQVDTGAPIILLGGVHVGCFELFGTERVRAIRDLEGKTVAALERGGAHHVFVATMAQYVGLNPHTDITWVQHSPAESIQLLAEGKIDALVGFPPVPQEIRARKIGHLIVNSAINRPWSQYFCCVMLGNREFVRQHPIATKRVLRAILKGADFCTLELERAARIIIEKGFTPRYDYALQAIQELP